MINNDGTYPANINSLDTGIDEEEDLSECCGAGTYGEYRICESCGEHCGEKQIDEDGGR